MALETSYEIVDARDNSATLRYNPNAKKQQYCTRANAYARAVGASAYHPSANCVLFIPSRCLALIERLNEF